MKEGLSEREKLVLYCIVRNPEHADRQLARDTDLNLSTVTAIRRRLHGRGYYKRVRIPRMQGMGSELLAVTYFYYKATIPLEIRLITGNKLVRDHREVFWAGSEYTQALSLQLAHNLTDARRNIAEIKELYTAQGFLDDGGVTFLTFPFEISKVPLFFDYEPLLRQTFSRLGEPYGLASQPGYLAPGQKPPKMTRVGKLVFHGLIEHPEHTDTELAKAISVSQRTVTKLRNTFEAAGLMSSAVMPDLGRLGFKMLVFDHAKLNLHLPEKQRMEILNLLAGIKPPIFMAIGGDDVAALTAYEDFETYRRCMNSFSEIYKHDDIFVGEPRRLMFSVAEMKMLKDHVYGPIAAKVLGLGDGTGPGARPASGQTAK
jgi:DNA-binding MarR family transcriptional regulator